MWCEIYKTDLSLKQLSTEDILRITNNENGFDITSAEALDQSTRFYDWLSYEILNSNPDYCFIPFGTGHLYENILNTNKREITTLEHDPRFQWDLEILRNANFFGSTTNDSTSKADKLYSPYLPFGHVSEQWIRMYKLAWYCGIRSWIYNFQERYLYEAIDLAKNLSIQFEPSGIAWLALFLQIQESIPKDKKILIINTWKSKYLDLLL